MSDVFYDGDLVALQPDGTYRYFKPGEITSWRDPLPLNARVYIRGQLFDPRDPPIWNIQNG